MGCSASIPKPEIGAKTDSSSCGSPGRHVQALDTEGKSRAMPAINPSEPRGEGDAPRVLYATPGVEENKVTRVVDNEKMVVGGVAAAVGVVTLLTSIQLAEKAKDLISRSGFLTNMLQEPGFISSALSALPGVVNALQTVANILIPPPGGQVLGAVIMIGAIVIGDCQNNTLMAQLAERCSKLMENVMEDETAKALESRPHLIYIIEEFRKCVDKIYAFMDETFKKGSTMSWAKRLLRWNDTHEKLQEMESDLDQIREQLSLGVALETFRLVQMAEQQKHQLEDSMKDVLLKYNATSLADIANNPEAMAAVVEACSTGSVTLASFNTLQLQQVILEQRHQANRGPHTMVHNTVMSQLWLRTGFGDQVKWPTFWEAFPSQVAPDDLKALLEGMFGASYGGMATIVGEHAKNRKLFELAVEDLEDPTSLSISEINRKLFPDDKLPDKIKGFMKAYQEGLAVSSQPSLPKNLVVREDMQTLAQLIKQGNRLILVQAWAGQGKFTTVCSAAANLQAKGLLRSTFVARLTGCVREGMVFDQLLAGLQAVLRPSNKKEALRVRLAQLQMLRTAEGLPWPMALILNHCEEATYKSLGPDLMECLQLALETVPHLSIIMCHAMPGSTSDLDPYRSPELAVPATPFTLKELSPKEGAAILRGCPGISIEKEEDARVIAQKQGCNPTLIKIMGGYMARGLTVKEAKELRLDKALGNIKDGAHVRAVLVRSFEAAHAAHAAVSLLLLADIMADNVQLSIASNVLDTDFVDTSDLVDSLVDMALLQPANLGTHAGAKEDTFMVVPIVRDFARSLLSMASETVVQKFPGLAQPVQQARARRVEAWFKQVQQVASTVRRLTDQYLSAPGASYHELCALAPSVHQVLEWTCNDSALNGNPAISSEVVAMLLLTCITPLVYHKTVMQLACRRLAVVWKTDRVASGTCRAVGALFFEESLDEKFGNAACLAEADLAVAALTAQAAPNAVLALAVALRARALILRALGDYPASVAAHMTALTSLQPLVQEGQDQITLELILHMGELSGTLDYFGEVESTAQGEQYGREAVALAESFFCGRPHPLQALCLGALGYNLRNSGNPQAALRVHTRAYEMRKACLGEMHQDTAMSLNQMALSNQDMAKQLWSETEGRVAIRTFAAVVKKTIADAGKEILAEVLLKTALEQFERSLVVRVTVLGPRHLMVANTEVGLAELQLLMVERLGQVKLRLGAIQNLKHALTIRREHLGVHHEKLIRPSQLLTQLYRDTQQYEEAAKVEAKYAKPPTPANTQSMTLRSVGPSPSSLGSQPLRPSPVSLPSIPFASVLASSLASLIGLVRPLGPVRALVPVHNSMSGQLILGEGPAAGLKGLASSPGTAPLVSPEGAASTPGTVPSMIPGGAASSLGRAPPMSPATAWATVVASTPASSATKDGRVSPTTGARGSSTKPGAPVSSAKAVRAAGAARAAGAGPGAVATSPSSEKPLIPASGFRSSPNSPPPPPPPPHTEHPSAPPQTSASLEPGTARASTTTGALAAAIVVGNAASSVAPGSLMGGTTRASTTPGTPDSASAVASCAAPRTSASLMASRFSSPSRTGPPALAPSLPSLGTSLL